MAVICAAGAGLKITRSRGPVCQRRGRHLLPTTAREAKGCLRNSPHTSHTGSETAAPTHTLGAAGSEVGGPHAGDCTGEMRAEDTEADPMVTAGLSDCVRTSHRTYVKDKCHSQRRGSASLALPALLMGRTAAHSPESLGPATPHPEGLGGGGSGNR